jgi:chemotaxis protein histidine kinase CheA/ActR/RegA family two-component response regulator
MRSLVDASQRSCVSVPALVDEIDRSLAELVNQVHMLAHPDQESEVTTLADAARRLSEVHGALLIIDQQGLAALVQLFRTQLLACGNAVRVQAADVASAARELRMVMRSALDGLLRGSPAVAGDLLACWKRLAVMDDASNPHPAALISLQFDTGMLPLLRSVPVSGIGLEESEPALLAFLRAQDDAQRSTAALHIADILSHAYAKASDTDERARWLALRAYLMEFAQAGGDSVRAKKIAAGTLRALRHIGQRAASLDALAREALFELTQHSLVTDEAHEVALLFNLDRQFSTPVELRPERLADDESASLWSDAVSAAIAAVETESDKLFEAEVWSALADAVTASGPLAIAEEWLRDIAAQRAHIEPDGLAMILLCLQACAQECNRSIDPLLSLMNSAREPEPVRALQSWWLALGADRLMFDFSSALRLDMLTAEPSLDTATSIAASRQMALAALNRIAGALHLLAFDDECNAVRALCARLDVADTSGSVFDDYTCLQWVQLQESFVLLPWRSLSSRAGTVVPPTLEEVSQHIDDSVESLDAIFIDEAGSLLRDLHSHAAASDHLALIHAAHTLAGCSATVGAIGIAELALALEEALARGVEADPTLLSATFDTLEAMLAKFAVSGHCMAEPQLTKRWRDGMPSLSATVVADDDKESDDQTIAQLPVDAATDVLQPDPNPTDEANVSSITPEVFTVEVNTEASLSLPDAPDAEAELLAIFNEEAADLLPQIEQAVRAWQRQPDDREQSARLLRVLHTLKGSARMAGQHVLGEDFHHAEAEVAALAQLAPSAVGVRLPALLERVDRWLQTLSGTPIPSINDQPVPTESIASARSPSPPEVSSPMLRVRAERLAHFADSSAEIWVGNSRLREGLQEQRRTVADLSDDLARLRTQLRELEIEAESRIMSRAAQESASDFDPLEFDRYTRLHELTRMMAESVTDIAGVQRGLVRQIEALSSAASAQARDLRRQQAELQALRSQPLRSVEARLRHLLRQAAREAGRDAELMIEGGEVEIERGMLDRLMGPLEHLLRNAVVHGIESSDEREQRGKPRAGRITLFAALAGNELRLTLSDDGRGLDLVRIRERALAVGLLPDAQSSPRALAALIFEPGFSTASEVTALSGRGIGMDAVRVELQALGGQVDVDSDSGQGCRFSIRLPAAMASMQVLLATAGSRRIALPATLMQQVLQLDLTQIKSGDDGSWIDWQGGAVRLLHLGQALGDVTGPADNTRVPVAVLRDGERVLAVQLDAIDGQREVIVKHPGAQLAQVPGLAGAVLLGDGGIALIIDPFRLPAISSVAPPRAPEKRAPLVLVVDDSLTVRRASQRLLERHGYAVALARDGVEALEQLQQLRPAAVLLDIEMPRMDGFELLAALRDDTRLSALPVVMITSRIAERHRERAAMLGATAYMGKPFDEDTLLGLLSQLCAAEAAVTGSW